MALSSALQRRSGPTTAWIRLRQGLTAIASRRTRQNLPARYRKGLPEAVVAHWEHLTPYDQHHLLAVASDLERSGSPETVVMAGLLHDIGKAGRVLLVARVAVVLLARFAPAVAWRIATSPRPIPGLHAIHLLLNHAERGAEHLASHGVRPEIVWLVRRHESTASHPYLAALQAADHRH